MAKNFLDKDGVSRLIYNFRNIFSSILHKHTISDLTDYTIDSALSSTSTNPIQNKVVNEGFSLVANSLSSMQTSIKGKADKEHEHTNYALTSYVDTTFAKKSDVQDVDLSNYYNKSETDSKLAESKQYTDTVASGKSDTNHNHDTVYDSKGSANTALNSSKSYTDSKISGLSSTYETKNDATEKLNQSKEYTDLIVAQKTTVQIVTWEEND